MGLSEQMTFVSGLSSVILRGEIMTDIQLRRFFDFDESDLDANRAGRLSIKQDKRMQEFEKDSSKIFRNIGIGLILLNILIVAGFILNVTGGGFSFSTASRDDLIGMAGMCQ